MHDQKETALTRNADFKNPHTLPNRAGRLLWNIAFIICYCWTPRRLGMPWRHLVLRCFGAKLGRTWIDPTVRIWAPWLLTTGDDVFIDSGCQLYNAFGITIEDRVVISFDSCLCTASHDHSRADFPLVGGPIYIESDVWIAAKAFVMPGTTIAHGSVVGACSVVTADVPAQQIVAGNPARIVRPRIVTHP